MMLMLVEGDNVINRIKKWLNKRSLRQYWLRNVKGGKHWGHTNENKDALSIKSYWKNLNANSQRM